MITYISIFVATVLIAMSFWKCDKTFCISNIMGTFAASLALGCLIGGTLSTFPQLYFRAFNKHWTDIGTNIYSNYIVSIRNNDEISGSFFLGCGSINSTEYYVYFKQYKDGGIKRGMMRTNLVTLYEKDIKDETPRTEWVTVTKRAHWLVRFGFDKVDIIERREGDYRIIVPKGTIIEKFEIK